MDLLMSNLATDAFQNALALLRKWRAERPEESPAYSTVMPPAPERDPATGSPPIRRGTIASTQQLLDSHDLTSEELVSRALHVIAEQNDDLYAFVEILEVDARDRAKKFDAERAAGRVRSPLHGIPVSVKDLYAVKGGTTRAGSLGYERRDDKDAKVVKRLKEAGAVVIGKTSTHEFAMGVTAPQSRNPHDPSRIAGGSSSGAAIAVATGMGMAAIGTDTRGSIRIPAALCGVVGLKPTFGTVPLDGTVPLSWSMDHVGVMAPSADDAATVLDALTRDRQIADEPVKGVSDIRVGLPRTAWQGVEPAVEHSIDSVMQTLIATGVELVDVQRPSAIDFDNANLTSMVVSRCEAAAFHRDLGLDPVLYTQDVRTQLEAASDASAQDYIDAQRLRAELQRDMLKVFDDVDVLLMPTVPIVAPPTETADQTPLVLTRNVALWSFVGFPAISVPCEPSAAGLPIGLQIVAAPHAEAAIIAVARAVERGVNAR
jgi:aspartyl-tRNA(Asn)/glutamyl-tRNA(Gln) amidotransferase subunit A